MEVNLRVETKYFTPGGVMSSRGTFKNDRLHGEWKYWYTTGALFIQEFYIDGKLHGPRLMWYGDGQLEFRSRYEHGKLVGIYEGWHPNGNIDYINNYRDDLLVDSHSWYVNGAIKNLVSVVGEYEKRSSWWDDGSPMEISYHRHGRRIGWSRGWWSDGNLMSSSKYYTDVNEYDLGPKHAMIFLRVKSWLRNRAQSKINSMFKLILGQGLNHIVTPFLFNRMKKKTNIHRVSPGVNQTN